MSSSLWNALETLLGSLARDLEESLETNERPDWETVAIDLEAAQSMVNALMRSQDRLNLHARSHVSKEHPA